MIVKHSTKSKKLRKLWNNYQGVKELNYAGSWIMNSGKDLNAHGQQLQE
jgi:hypothetical protein